MKKILFVLTLALAVIMTGCNNDAGSDNQNNGTGNDGQQGTQTIVGPSVTFTFTPGEGNLEIARIEPRQASINPPYEEEVLALIVSADDILYNGNPIKVKAIFKNEVEHRLPIFTDDQFDDEIRDFIDNHDGQSIRVNLCVDPDNYQNLLYTFTVVE